MAIEITEEMILNAETYVSMRIKKNVADVVATMCAEKIDVSPDAPPMYKENRARKAQFLMGILRRYYFNIAPEQKVTLSVTDGRGHGTEAKVDWYMVDADYDEWAGSHVMNQIERLKKSKNEEVRNKAYDLLYDFKGFEVMVNGATRELIERNNEPCCRLMEMFQHMASPEYTEELKRRIAEVQAEAEEFAASHKNKEQTDG